MVPHIFIFKCSNFLKHYIGVKLAKSYAYNFLISKRFLSLKILGIMSILISAHNYFLECTIFLESLELMKGKSGKPNAEKSEDTRFSLEQGKFL